MSRLGVAEDVRVATNELVGDRRERIGDGEVARLGAQLGQQHAFEDHVADLLAQGRAVAPVDRLEHLVGLLEDEGAKGLERLFPVPGTAVRRAEAGDDVDEAGEPAAGVSDMSRMLPFQIGPPLRRGRAPGGSLMADSRRSRSACSSCRSPRAPRSTWAACRLQARTSPAAQPQEAAHLIEVLAMLKDKTAGNLDEDEERLVDSVLYDLRMRFVERPAGEKRVVEP